MHALVLEKKYVKLSVAGKQRREKCEHECLCTGCMKPLDGRVVRHMHERCRKAAERLINTGLVTEEDLIRNGEMVPKSTCGRKPSNPLVVKYTT